MNQPQPYAPQHAQPGQPRRPVKRTTRVVAVVAACTLGIAVVGTGAWLVLGGTVGNDADLDGFCEAADTYFAQSGQTFEYPDRTRALVAARVEAADDMARRAPSDIGSTAADYAADVRAGAAVFERYGYAPDLVEKALAGTLKPPVDAAGVLRVAGYSYAGDVGGQRGGEIAAYREGHCPRDGNG